MVNLLQSNSQCVLIICLMDSLCQSPRAIDHHGLICSQIGLVNVRCIPSSNVLFFSGYRFWHICVLHSLTESVS